MKKHLIDFLVGLVLGLIYLFLSAVFELDLIGVDIVLSQFSGTAGLLLSGVFLIVLGIIPFLVYIFVPWYRRTHPGLGPKSLILSFILFSVGIYASFILFALFAAIAFSQTTGPF